jgi:hypothetical protein
VHARAHALRGDLPLSLWLGKQTDVSGVGSLSVDVRLTSAGSSPVKGTLTKMEFTMTIVLGLLFAAFVVLIVWLLLRASKSQPRFNVTAYTNRRHPPSRVHVPKAWAHRAPRDVTTNPYTVTYPNRDIPEVVSPLAARALGIGSPDDR